MSSEWVQKFSEQCINKEEKRKEKEKRHGNVVQDRRSCQGIPGSECIK